MLNTGMNLWEKDKIKLALTEDCKNKYKIDFPEIELKKKLNQKKLEFLNLKLLGNKLKIVKLKFFYD